MHIQEVEKTIGIPSEKWRGRCHEIAELMLKHKLVKGRLRYGYWTGPVSRRSKFEKYPDGLIHHGWIELSNGQILDPTRFEFEQRHPYIYVGANDYYDAGGNKSRMKNMLPPPVFDFTEKCTILTINDGNAIKFIENHLNRKVTDNHVVVTVNQAFWLANLSLLVLKDACKPIFTALIQADLEAFIPIDNNRLAFEKL